MQKYSAFSYKPGKSIFHKMPAWLKILLIPVVSLIVFNLPPLVSVIFVILQFAAACFLHFSIREQLCDLKPVILYGFLLYLAGFIAVFLSTSFTPEIKQDWNFFAVLKATIKAVFLNYETLFQLIKLFALMQAASIIFKTSTSLEIRDGVGKIEFVIRKALHLKAKNRLTNTISMFVCFIPLVYKIWERSKLTWKARGGKKNIRMYLKLLPVLFSVGMKEAWNMARAMSAREIDAPQEDKGL